MQLNVDQKTKLVKILEKAINRDELRDLVQLSLNDDLLFRELASPTKPDHVVVMDLVAALERHEITGNLVAMALKLRPAVTALADFCGECFPLLLKAPAPTTEAVGNAVAGVKVVLDQLGNPAIRQQIATAGDRVLLGGMASFSPPVSPCRPCTHSRSCQVRVVHRNERIARIRNRAGIDEIARRVVRTEVTDRTVTPIGMLNGEGVVNFRKHR